MKALSSNYIVSRRYSRNRRKALLQKVKLIAILLLSIVFLFGILEIFSTNVLGTKDYTKSYVSLRVDYGDTLWEIASQYYDEDILSLQEYIDEIVRANDIVDGEIEAGSRITIPMYTTNVSD